MALRRTAEGIAAFVLFSLYIVLVLATFALHCDTVQPANDPLIVSEEAINKLELECVKICPTIECSTDCRNTIRKAWASEHDVTITDLDANRHHYSKE